MSGGSFFSNLSSKMKHGILQAKQSLSEVIHSPTFTLKEQFGFASGSFGNTMGQDMIGTFLVLFLTDYMGIDSSMVIILMAVAKIVNIFGDPLAGALLDRPVKNLNRGKARPFLLLSPIPLTVTSILLFIVPNISYQARLVYVFVFYLIYCLSDTFYDMSLMTVSARMTNNPHDRKNFYTVAEFAATLGSMLPGGVIPVFISLYKEDYGAQRGVYLVATIIFGILGICMMIIPYFTLREKTLTVSIKKPKTHFNFRALFTNRPLFLLMLSSLFDSIRQVCYGALTYFFAKTLGAFWISTVIGAITATLSYVSIALVPFLGRKMSPRDMAVFGYAYTGVFYLLLLITGYKSLFVVALLLSLSGATTGMIRTSKRVMLADSTDYMEWRTWKKFGVPVRSEGMVFAMNSMAGRVSGLWKDLLLPAGLTLIGYVSATVGADGQTYEAVQSPETLRGIFYLVTIPGIIGTFIPAAILMFDNFTGKRRDHILKELEELHTAAQASETQTEEEVVIEEA